MRNGVPACRHKSATLQQKRQVALPSLTLAQSLMFSPSRPIGSANDLSGGGGPGPSSGPRWALDQLAHGGAMHTQRMRRALMYPKMAA